MSVRHISHGFISGLPLESRCFENIRIVQEDQKTICAIIELLMAISLKYNPLFWAGWSLSINYDLNYGLECQKRLKMSLKTYFLRNLFYLIALPFRRKSLFCWMPYKRTTFLRKKYVISKKLPPLYLCGSSCLVKLAKHRDSNGKKCDFLKMLQKTKSIWPFSWP